MKDILLDADFELLITAGDFVAGESTRQHQQLLLLVEKGELREFPTRGVGLASWLNDESPGDLNSLIKREYEADGMRVLQISGIAPHIRVEAIYE